MGHAIHVYVHAFVGLHISSKYSCRLWDQETVSGHVLDTALAPDQDSCRLWDLERVSGHMLDTSLASDQDSVSCRLWDLVPVYGIWFQSMGTYWTGHGSMQDSKFIDSGHMHTNLGTSSRPDLKQAMWSSLRAHAHRRKVLCSWYQVSPYVDN